VIVLLFPVNSFHLVNNAKSHGIFYLYALYQAGRIAQEKAVAIARGSPGDAGRQQAGIMYAGEPGVQAPDVQNFMAQLSAMPMPGRAAGGALKTDKFQNY
jgi:hypothetical protein